MLVQNEDIQLKYNESDEKTLMETADLQKPKSLIDFLKTMSPDKGAKGQSDDQKNAKKREEDSMSE